MTDRDREPDARPHIGQLHLEELIRALKAGVDDFRRAPLFGLAFSAVYVVTGIGLIWLGAGTFTWTLMLATGFPLIAPFAAVGLYETSRRLESGEPLHWRAILARVWSERARQVPWIGVILLMIFLFWSFFAHMSFALFLGRTSFVSLTDPSALLDAPNGLALIGFELVVGAAVALLTFALSVVSIPLLMEREIDVVTAMLISVETVMRNKLVLLVWAMIIAALVFVALIPAFLGLFVVLPVLGHATWHLYRRALYFPV